MPRSKNEPRDDKTNNVAVRPANTQISLGIRKLLHADSEDCLIRVFAVCMKKA